MGAPLGNQNAVKAKRWQKALERALSRASNENIDAGLDKCADKLVAAAIDGDQWALREIGDRIDGKPAQAIVGDSEADPINILNKIERAVIDPQNRDS